MKEIFSYTKLFTILLTIFYILGLLGSFNNKVILFCAISFGFLTILILLTNLGLRKSLILLVIFFVGLIRAKSSMKLPIDLDNIYANNAIITGQIVSSKEIKNNKIKFYFRADDADINGKTYKKLNSKFLISSFNKDLNISIGDYARISGKLRHPTPATNPHQFDYQKYLLNNDIKNILYLENYEKIKEPNFKNDPWYTTLAKFEKTREQIIEKHSKNIKSPNLEILGGIVFGNETINPDEKIKENFKNSGLLHLLAASGLNVALIYGIWWWIASLIRFPYNLSILIGAIFVILYTFMTGFPPSILRASIMLLFVLLGKIIDRNANSLALVFFVGLLILLFSPKMLYDVGFQLSFAVTIGLISCVPIIISKFKKLDKKYQEKYKKLSRIEKYFISLFSPSNLATIVAIPLVAQIFVIPLQLHYFNNFAPYSILANVAVVPFIGLLSFIGFISSIFALIPFLNKEIIFLFDSIANPLLTLLIKISEFFVSFKHSLVTTSAFNLFQIFTFWIIAFVFTLNLKNNFKNKKQIIILISITTIFLTSFVNLNHFNKNLEITMFDVKNADCFLIKTPKNKYIMIDTGKQSYNGKSDAYYFINKYLKNEKINKLETLIITHFDADHAGGSIDILKTNPTKNIIIQNEITKTQLAKDILKYLKENKLNYKVAKNNEIVYIEDNLSIKTFKTNSKDENKGSIITLLSHKNKNILFMADSDSKNYEKIKNKLPNKIDIIKIGHHGAKNSINQNMIRTLKPNYALISVGYNKFNHPDKSTIEILKNNNVKILSSKDSGFIKIIFKNNKEKIYLYNNKTKKLKNLN